jgi:hypothetical protein
LRGVVHSSPTSNKKCYRVMPLFGFHLTPSFKLSMLLKTIIFKCMKKNSFLIIFLFISLFLEAAPFSKNRHIFSADISVDFFTRASILADSVWYSTIMPAYRFGYSFNWLRKENQLHRFIFKIRYFGSNRFKLNSFELEKGEMRIVLLDINLEYLRYLSIGSYVAFVTGMLIAPKYSYFGQRIAPGETWIEKETVLGLGPVFGFSFHKPDFLEFTAFVTIKLGFPLYGRLTYPDESNEKTKKYSLDGIVSSYLNFYIRWFRIGLEYSYTLYCYVSVKKGSELIEPTDYSHMGIHSISISLGVAF